MPTKFRQILLIVASVWISSSTPMLATFRYATRGLEQMSAVLSLSDSLSRSRSEADSQVVFVDTTIVFAKLAMLPALESVSFIDGEVSDTIKIIRESGKPTGRRRRAGHGLKHTSFPVKMRFDHTGRVVHIGYNIFKFEIPQHQQVLDFIERYTLDLDLPIKRNRSLSTRLAEDDIEFQTGEFRKLKTLAADTSLVLTITKPDKRSYAVEWTDTLGNTKMKMTFPVNFELLLGASVLELEKSLLKEIEAAEPVTREQPAAIDSLLLENRFYPDYYVLPGDELFISALNSDRYYHRLDDGEFVLTYTPKFPIESAINIMTGNEIEHAHMANVKLVAYSGADSIRVPLTNVVSTLLQQDFTPFCGLMDIQRTKVKITCLYKNDILGFAHMVRFSADLRHFPDQPTDFDVRLMPYIPINKIINLFGNSYEDNTPKEPKPFGTLDVGQSDDYDIDNGGDQGGD